MYDESLVGTGASVPCREGVPRAMSNLKYVKVCLIIGSIIESIINWNKNTFNQECNDAAVYIKPLNEGETFLNIKDEITGQVVKCKITVTH